MMTGYRVRRHFGVDVESIAGMMALDDVDGRPDDDVLS